MSLKADPRLLQSNLDPKAPAVNAAYVVRTDMADHLHRQLTGANLDKLLKDVLEVGLKNSGLFTPTANDEYVVYAHLEDASQSTFSFGRFNGTFDVTYKVADNKGNVIFTTRIKTTAGSDKYYIIGEQRHTRARIVNCSKNVNQFIAEFNQFLLDQNKSKNAGKKKG
ncbi:hypothetical protein [Psittacicella hinzii]|nr:hypothetical protein [Psittacicella hinzii]